MVITNNLTTYGSFDECFGCQGEGGSRYGVCVWRVCVVVYVHVTTFEKSVWKNK